MVIYFAIDPVLPDLSTIAIRHRGLQSYVVHASLTRSPRKHKALIGTTMDALKPFMYELVMSRSAKPPQA
jgi:hypothetical protein